MIQHILFFSFLLLSATLFSCIEIQIEGKNGWAELLPTWKIRNKWTKKIMADKPLTGYHLYINLFILSILHYPYIFFYTCPTIKYELKNLSFLILFWIIEDFLWFVLNKDFGIKKFRKEDISWHKNNWFIIMPREYWIFTPIGIILYYFSLN